MCVCVCVCARARARTRFVTDYSVDLYSCDLNELDSEVLCPYSARPPLFSSFCSLTPMVVAPLLPVRQLTKSRNERLLTTNTNDDSSQSQVSAKWRMVGVLNLPWRPKIDLVGRTRFRYDSSKGNRIVDYFETWETPAAQVLLNLLKPGGN